MPQAQVGTFKSSGISSPASYAVKVSGEITQAPTSGDSVKDGGKTLEGKIFPPGGADWFRYTGEIVDFASASSLTLKGASVTQAPTGQQATQQPTTGQQATQQPTTGQQATQQASTGQQQGQQQATQQASTGQQQAGMMAALPGPFSDLSPAILAAAAGAALLLFISQS